METSHRLDDKHWSNETRPFIANRCRNVSAAADQNCDCWNLTSRISHILEDDVIPNFFQFPYEFTLLACERLLFWFHNRALFERDPIREHPELESTSSYELENSTNSTYGTIDIPRLHNPTGFITSSGCWKNYFISKLGYLASVTLNTTYAVFAIWLGNMKNEERIGRFKNSFFVGNLIYWLASSLSIVVGTIYSNRIDRKIPTDSSNAKKKKRPLTGLQYLLIFSSVGPFASLSFSIFAFVSLLEVTGSDGFVSKYKMDPFVYLFSDVFIVLFVYLQMSFCHCASTTSSHASSVDRDRHSLEWKVFQLVVFHLAFSNLTQWTVDSFATFNNYKSLYLSRIVFDEQKFSVVINAHLPLNLFFWFNSCLLFTKFYLQSLKPRST